MSTRRRPPPVQGSPPTRLLPHDPEAETAVAGACLQDPAALDQASGIVGPGDFFMQKHRYIFEAMLDIRTRGEAVDLVTTTAELRHRARLDVVGGPAALASLVEAVPTAANVAYHARIVREAAVKRSFAEKAEALARHAVNGLDIEELRAHAEEAVKSLVAQVVRREDRTCGVDTFLNSPPELTWDLERVRLRGDHGWSGGAPKAMKGLVSLEEARACATGTPFLGHFPARKARVLYLSEEDRAERLHRRVHAMLAGRPPEEIPGPDELRFLVKAGVRLDTAEGIGILRGALERWRPEIVFLEHFDKLHSRDSNKAADVKPLLDELDRLHAEFGCTFRVQKHHRKEAAGQSRRPGEMLAGSVALFGWGESSIFMTLVRRGLAQVEVEAKDGDTSPRFLVEYQGGRVVYAGEVKANRKEQARERVLELLAQKPGATTEEVAEELKVTSRTAGSRLRELEEAGLVEAQQASSRQPKEWFLKSTENKA